MYYDVPELKGNQSEVTRKFCDALEFETGLRWGSVRYQCVIQVSMTADKMV